MTPPRLIARAIAVSFVTVAVVLSVVFTVLTVDARDRVRSSETEKVQVSERMFTAFEQERQEAQLGAIATMAENPTMKAALDTYYTETRFTGVTADRDRELRQTVKIEAEKLATATAADVLAILDQNGHVFVAAGPENDRWPTGERVNLGSHAQPTFQAVAVLPAGAFRVSAARLSLGDRVVRDVGTLVLATSLDDHYAQELAALSRSGIVITVNDRVVARTVPPGVARDLVAAGREPGTERRLGNEDYAIGTLLASGAVRIFTLTSIDAAARASTRNALTTLAMIAFGSFVLAVLGSIWLARTLTRPINRVSGEIARMTAAREFGRTLEATGTSRELDALTAAFNEMMHGLAAAEADTRAAYLGSIRALAAALDARDPYTAGHSERVSAYSVLMARHMNVPVPQVDIIRLGALLHDIGKIGVEDAILRKPGPLTAAEFEQIKRHPSLGARILRQVPFLEPHLPIVELHHERPDGKGYPFGLRGDDIPLPARIVHVADAFDAMTSARAYRPARDSAWAIAELRRHAGTEFDAPCVEAIATAIPLAGAAMEPQIQELLPPHSPTTTEPRVVEPRA
jgi:putative nucleotidyltransferase with HDIG domain